MPRVQDFELMSRKTQMRIANDLTEDSDFSDVPNSVNVCELLENECFFCFKKVNCNFFY